MNVRTKAFAMPLTSPTFPSDGSARICDLVEYYLGDITIKGAWTGRGATASSRRPGRRRGESNALTGESLVVSHGWFMQ